MSKFLGKNCALRAKVTPYNGKDEIPNGAREIFLASKKYIIIQKYNNPMPRETNELQGIIERAAYNFPDTSIELKIHKNNKLELLVKEI